MTFWNELKILFIPAMFCLEDAMKKFTECSASKMEGNIASWQQISASWDASSFLDKQDFCSGKTLGVKILPFSVPFFLANTICKQLHGSIYVYQASINETFMDTTLNTTVLDGKIFWTGYTDAKESGKFVSLDGALNFDSIPGLQWQWGQPNGYFIENCTMLEGPVSNLVYDYDCEETALVTCDIGYNPKFTFRGEHSLPIQDEEYFLMQLGAESKPSDYSMKSSHGKVIEKVDSLWQLTKDGNVLAVQDSSEFIPFGVNDWISTETNKTMRLNLNACLNSEFSCDDGSCLSKLVRCNGKYDCSDHSDELTCSFIEPSPNYHKLTLPLDANNKLKLQFSIRINNILDIDNLRETFKVKFYLETNWVDDRIFYYNLQPKEDNVINYAYWEKMWIPNYKFENTENGVMTSNLGEKDSSVSLALLNDKHQLGVGSSKLRQDFSYPGSDVRISKRNVYTIEFNCDYIWRSYPFDSQTCPIMIDLLTKISSKIDIEIFANISEISYANYFVELEKAGLVPGKEYIRVEIPLTFRRDIKSILLTTYMPTLILTLINQLTNYFIGPDMFETVVTINATTLLTLTSLFISTFESLPQTTNIKLIDVWMLATFVYPFCIIIIHTLIHVNSKNGSCNTRMIEKTLMLIGKVGLPVAFAVFTVAYGAYGAYRSYSL